MITYAEIVIFATYNFKNFIAFVTMYLKLKTLGDLFKIMSELITKEIKAQSLENQNVLKNIIKFYAIIALFNVVPMGLIVAISKDDFVSYQRYFFDDSATPLKQILLAVTFVAGSLSCLVNLIIQICYYSFCIHIVTLYQQLHRLILQLNYKKKEEIDAIIKESVDLHVKIIEMLHQMKSQFSLLLLWDFVSYIVVLGMILFNVSSTVAFLRMIIFLPAAAFASWIFCHGSYLVKNEGERMAIRLYTDTKWYEMDIRHQKSILIMMAQFQKLNEIKLVGIQTVDLELLTIVSLTFTMRTFASLTINFQMARTAYSIFNIMITLNK